MLAFMILALLLGLQELPQTTHFRPLKKSLVPSVLFASDPPCPAPDEPSDCGWRFREVGNAWTGDVNGDGVNELLVVPGTGGTGGSDMWLYQKVGNRWRPILHAFPYLERLGILPIVRSGYHDLHLDSLHCYKWNGRKYVAYVPEDYRKLRPGFFAISNPDNASILWLARYGGLKEFDFEPRWFLFQPQPTHLGDALEDHEYNLRWVAEYKGPVWGVRGKRSFLILPRPAHTGGDRLDFEGDWFLIYSDWGGMTERRPVARYNRRTHRLVIETRDPFWLMVD